MARSSVIAFLSYIGPNLDISGHMNAGARSRAFVRASGRRVKRPDPLPYLLIIVDFCLPCGA